MKKTILLLCVIALASCGTTKITTKVEPVTITESDSNWCVATVLSASINQDSLLIIFQEGFILGTAPNTMKIWYEEGFSNPLNGFVIIEPNYCASNTGFCLTGQYAISVNSDKFLSTLQTGIVLRSGTASVALSYWNGKLTAIPKVCIKKTR